MKHILQISIVPAAALTGAFAWFAFWLTAFQPIVQHPVQPVPQPSAVLCHPADEPRQSPTLFALPSKAGFSGDFPPNRVDVPLTLERPRQPETYLSRQPAAAPEPDQTKLVSTISFPQCDLPAPGAIRTTEPRHAEPIALFFSPSLAPRAQDITLPADIEPLPTGSIRIQLTVLPDGHVVHAFFDEPIKNAALMSAARTLRFSPADEETNGWLDIRFTPAQEKAKGTR